MLNLADEQAKMHVLVEWGLANGCYLANVEFSVHLSICSTLCSRVATAKQDIATDTLIFSSPLCLRIPESLARSSESGILLSRQLEVTKIEKWSSKSDDPLVIGVLYLIAYLMHQLSLGSASFWNPYLASLPANFETLPVTFSKSTLKRLLHGTQLYDITKKRITILQSGFEIIKEACSDLFSVNFDAFMWSYCVISSRAFPDLVIQDEVCLYPILDMLDHSPTTRIHWTTTNTATTFITATSIDQGAVLMNNYGPKGNQNLLSNYGFVIDENESDYFILSLKGVCSGTWYLNRTTKLEFYEQMDMQGFADLFECIAKKYFGIQRGVLSCEMDANERNAHVYIAGQIAIFEFHLGYMKLHFDSQADHIVHASDLDMKSCVELPTYLDQLMHLPEESLLALMLIGSNQSFGDTAELDADQREDLTAHFEEDIAPSAPPTVSLKLFCQAAAVVQEQMVILGKNTLRYIGTLAKEAVIVYLDKKTYT